MWLDMASKNLSSAFRMYFHDFLLLGSSEITLNFTTSLLPILHQLFQLFLKADTTNESLFILATILIILEPSAQLLMGKKRGNNFRTHLDGEFMQLLQKLDNFKLMQEESLFNHLRAMRNICQFLGPQTMQVYLYSDSTFIPLLSQLLELHINDRDVFLLDTDLVQEQVTRGYCHIFPKSYSWFNDPKIFYELFLIVLDSVKCPQNVTFLLSSSDVFLLSMTTRAVIASDESLEIKLSLLKPTLLNHCERIIALFEDHNVQLERTVLYEVALSLELFANFSKIFCNPSIPLASTLEILAQIIVPVAFCLNCDSTLVSSSAEIFCEILPKNLSQHLGMRDLEDVISLLGDQLVSSVMLDLNKMLFMIKFSTPTNYLEVDDERSVSFLRLSSLHPTQVEPQKLDSYATISLFDEPRAPLPMHDQFNELLQLDSRSPTQMANSQEYE
ncbi:hypothetical protein Ciccas_000997 [Cichlidogyrus casuarinus]|uniref:Uncharacterized protein n=1 Tax=Cichlidogyrus casuarinus TaxID=1844966 RepID=A0ABD2QLB5_9PLAT